MGGLEIPSTYRDGYRKAAALNPGLAASYVENTVVDDPLADAVVEALAALDGADVNRFMNAGVEQDTRVLDEAPRAVRDFFKALEDPPDWFDRNAVLPGRSAVHEHLDLFIIGFVAVSLRNFNSLMSKVFFMTGQFTTHQGLRLIRNNIRYLTELLMLPGSLDRRGAGWRFSVRIRLVHARIRRQLRRSDRWDEVILGAPISAANMALTSANFSASLIRDVERLGANLDAEERAGLMQIWRYASWLIGTPEALLCGGDEAETAELSRIGHLCEPPPDRVSVVITNATVMALPEVAKLTDPVAKRSMVNHGYRVSRALLGDELADQFGFPQQGSAGLPLARRGCGEANPFMLLLDAAMVDGLRNRFPAEMAAAKAGLVPPERT